MKFPELAGRLLIAIPGILLFLFVLFFLPCRWGLLLLSALSLLAAWEILPLFGTSDCPVQKVIVSLLTGISTLLIAVDHPLAFPALLAAGAFIALPEMVRSGPSGARRIISGTVGTLSFYAIGFGMLGRLLVHSPGGQWLALSVLAVCWVGDSAAYFTGIALGRRKLMPGVSPKKSWEGFFGGIIGGVAGSVLAGYAGSFDLLPFAFAGVAGGLAGTAGDLFESALKRDAGVKDSSTLLLGHGGILDRFDSAVAAAPAAFAVFFLFGFFS
ncbi:hypothetical protein CSA37_11120 [Candidatus Fermentibacteria bacterium]|nr:MAG: hypothetical protein CSA37_11120 [Candidatus Fermentibacteria bacterium]